MRNRGHAGFTLIELLVVIVIIGILSSMMFGALFWWNEAKAKDTAVSQIKIFKTALNEYKLDNDGSYPRTDRLSSDDEKQRGVLFFQAMTGLVDRWGKKVKADRRGKNFLPEWHSMSLGSDEDGEIRQVTVAVEQMEREELPEVFLLDPWGNPYVYEFPRRDGHTGYLLFSKGPDGESSVFDSELTATPRKETEDEDNIPDSEPGNWKN